MKTKRINRLLAILLMLVIAIGLFPMNTFAADNVFEVDRYDGPDVSGDGCYSLKAAIDKINSSDFSGEFVILLQSDIECTDAVPDFKKNTTTILGNGHKIVFEGTWSCRLGTSENATLNLGKHDGNMEENTLILTANMPDNPHNFPLLSIKHTSIVNMYDGVVLTGNNAKSGCDGAGVDIRGGIFNMHGGLISENTSENGSGGVSIVDNSGYDCTFNMYGGTISGNTSKVNGGGVGLNDNTNNNTAVFNMYGGTISGNTANQSGGGIFSSNGNFNISGKIIICGNTVKVNETKKPNNVQFSNNTSMLNITGTLLADSNIGITTSEGSDFTSGYLENNPGTQPSSFFFSDIGKSVILNANEAQLHTHNFNQEAPNESYLKSAATCTTPAVYYTFCSCGESSKGTLYETTFDIGTSNGHSFTSEPSHCLASFANCTEAVQHYVKCDNCSEISSILTVAIGHPTDHDWSADWMHSNHYHWHECLNENCPVEEDSLKNGYAEHKYDNDADITCNVCNYERTVSEYVITFDTGEETVEPTFAITEDGKLTTLPIPTRSGYQFDGWFTEETGGEKVDRGTVFGETDTIYARWTRISSSDGGTATYSIVVDQVENGKVSANKTYASVGSKITLTITPDENYRLRFLTVTDRRDNEITLTASSDGIYNFKMPNSKVTVKAEFVKIDSVAGCTGDKTCPAYQFFDLDLSKWYHDGIHYCVENGMMNGVSDNLFAPAAATTRGMFVTILYRLEGEPIVSGDCPFDDVKAGSWYEDAVTWAAANKIVSGYGSGNYGSEDAITREQMATILYRYAQYKGYEVTSQIDLSKFIDDHEISTWAETALSWANDRGLVEGDGSKLMPKGSAERCQVAAILYRFCQNAAK